MKSFPFCSRTPTFDEARLRDQFIFPSIKISGENKCLLFCERVFYNDLLDASSKKLSGNMPPFPHSLTQCV